MAEVVEVISADHDIVIKSNFVPTIKIDMHMPKTPNLGFFSNQDDHVGVKHIEIIPTSAVMQEMESGRFVTKKLNKYMFLFINTYVGGDRNHRFDRAQSSLLWLTQKHNLEKITCAKVIILPKFIIPILIS